MAAKSLSEEIRWYLNILARWAWLILLFTILAGLIAYVLSNNIKPTYQASALVLIEAPNINSIDYSSVMTGERLAKTYAERMTTRPVLEGVIMRLNLDMNAAELVKSIKVQPVRDTQLIEVHVRSKNAMQSAMIANMLVIEFSEKNLAQQASRYTATKMNFEAQLNQLDQQIQSTSEKIGDSEITGDQVERDRLETELAQYRQIYASLLQSYEQVRLAEVQSTSNVVLEESATLPVDPISPRIITNTILASILGLLLVIGLVFLLEVLDDSVHSPDQIAQDLNLPILGLIGHHDEKGKEPITVLQPRAAIAEAFRSIRTNIDFTSIDKPLRSLLIISPTPQEGKSTVAANLAIVLAQSERRVILVDADLRRPSLHKQFGFHNQRGLGDLFLIPKLSQLDQRHIDSILCTTSIPNLRVLTAGKHVPNPAELIGSTKMDEILNSLAEITDIVVFDSSPVLAVTDAVVLAPRTDGVILIAKPGSTKLDACRQAVEQLRRVGANLLGVVLNDVHFKRSSYTYYRYNGHYTYDEQDRGANFGKPKAKSNNNLKDKFRFSK